MDKNELKKARNRCYRLLSLRPRTEYELIQKLKNDGYDGEMTEVLMSELKNKQLLDDRLFAANWIRWRLSSKPLGKEYLRAELKYKGVCNNIIEEELTLYYSNEKEIKMAMLAAERKLKGQCLNESDYRKLAGFLARRGFSSSIIARVLRLLTGSRPVDIS